MNHDKIMEIHWKCHMKARRQQCVDTEYLMDFAELIIREAIWIAYHSHALSKDAKFTDHLDAIKEHFGVEE